MGATAAACWMWARSDWRRRWPAIAVLTLVVAVGGGTALGAVAAARRTDSAFERFRSAVHDGDVIVNGLTDDGLVELDLSQVDDVAQIDGVIEAVAYSVMGIGVLLPADPSSPGEQSTPSVVPGYFSPALVATRGTPAREVIVEGRAQDRAAIDEIMINEAMRDELGLAVGDRVQLASLTPAQWDRYGRGDSIDVPEGPTVDVRVVGVYRDVEAISDAHDPILVLTAAFWSKYRTEVGHCDCIVAAHTEPAARDTVLAAVRDLFGDGPIITPAEPYNARVRDTVALQRRAFWLIAGVATLGLVVALSAASARFVAGRRVEDDVWRSLGMEHRRLVLARAVAQAPAAVIGTAGAVFVAYVASPLSPVGLARRAEPDPGLRADWSVFSIGAPTVLLGALGLFVVVASWAGRAASHRPSHHATVGSALTPTARFGLRAVATAGRAGVVGVVAAVGGLVGALTLQASIDHLLVTPVLYGADYTAVTMSEVRKPEVTDELDALRDQLAVDPDVEAVAQGWSSGHSGPELEGPRGTTAAFADAFVPVVGSIGPVIASGRAPAAVDEAAVGRGVLREIGAEVGDEITVRGERGDARFRVVGVIVQAGVDESDSGFTLTRDGLARVDEPSLFAVYVRLAEGADLSAFQQRYPDTFDIPAPSSEVGNVGQLGRLPMWVAVTVVALGVGVVLEGWAVSQRRNRRELAIHRALGFTPRQTRRAISWQGVFTLVAGVVPGLVLGFIAGRFIHHRLMVDVGVSTETIVPLSIWIVAVGAFATGIAFSAPFALSATRERVARVLRSE